MHLIMLMLRIEKPSFLFNNCKSLVGVLTDEVTKELRLCSVKSDEAIANGERRVRCPGNILSIRYRDVTLQST